jgi:hypothetical protein
MRKRTTNAAFLWVCLLSEISEGAFERRMSVFFGARFALHAVLVSFSIIHPFTISGFTHDADDGSDVI